MKVDSGLGTIMTFVALQYPPQVRVAIIGTARASSERLYKDRLGEFLVRAPVA